MLVINCRNVNDGFIRGLDLLNEFRDDIRDSRGGYVVEAPCPVATVYRHPEERVLFEPIRKANPFFHFMESLWMLGGRNDLDYVMKYNKRMKDYSDDGIILHGAYGHRWREHFGGDQVEMVIQRLKMDSNDRRCVVQMWDPLVDLNRAGVDVPCNISIYFKIRDDGLLMTVSNRSNDIIWGTFGANAVHMSMLHEYVASAIGIRIGPYTQISDSFHAYTNVFDDMHAKLEAEDAFDYYTMKESINPYQNKAITPYPMMTVPQNLWDVDLVDFLNRKPFGDEVFHDEFFTEVACPLQDAWYCYKKGEYKEALVEVQRCEATDWCTAGFDWLNSSIKTKEK
jgi:thymidylate synthase